MGLWGGNFIVVKAAVAELPPVGFTALRFALAAVTLLLLLRWREGSIGLPRRDLGAVLLLGGIGFGVYQIAWTTGLTTVAAGDSALIIASTPVVVAILAVVAGSDVLTPAKLAGSLISFGGVAVVVASGPGLALGGSLGGELLTLAAAVSWAVYTSFGAPVLRRHSPLRVTTWATVSGAVILAPIGVLQLASADTTGLGPGILGALLYSGMIATGTANVVVFHGIKLVGPTRATAYQFLVPAVAVVFAALFLGEAIRPGQVLGGAIIIGGILLARRGGPGTRFAGRRRAAPEALP